jgi:hypothetical protein
LGEVTIDQPGSDIAVSGIFAAAVAALPRNGAMFPAASEELGELPDELLIPLGRFAAKLKITSPMPTEQTLKARPTRELKSPD